LKKEIIYIDAFTNTRLTGNPCAVLPEAEGLDDEQIQAIAKETNLSETAFVFPSDKADFRVRYFMPTGEIPFAGHPTIATAFTLAQEGLIKLNGPKTTVNFEFNIGVLPLDILLGEDGGPERVIMTQAKPEFGPKVEREKLAPALGLQPEDIPSGLKSQVVSTGVGFLVVPVTGLDALKKLSMQKDLLAPICAEVGVHAAYVFAPEGFDPGSDLHSRLIVPDLGHEDPFTGSAAGTLAAYAVRHGVKTGPILKLEQGDMVGRPGRAVLETVGSPGDLETVRVGGPAVRSLEGYIYLP
jgi:trans-2,3-dihydro-3-hydroxyanthranilate isomerase